MKKAIVALARRLAVMKSCPSRDDGEADISRRLPNDRDEGRPTPAPA